MEVRREGRHEARTESYARVSEHERKRKAERDRENLRCVPLHPAQNGDLKDGGGKQGKWDLLFFLGVFSRESTEVRYKGAVMGCFLVHRDPGWVILASRSGG